MIHSILAWEGALALPLKQTAAAVRQALTPLLPGTELRLFHGAPVWFLAGNPLAGYSVSRGEIALLFWSGKSFDDPALVGKGKHQAAEARFSGPQSVLEAPLARWCALALTIQWDYKNIVKNQGRLDRLV